MKFFGGVGCATRNNLDFGGDPWDTGIFKGMFTVAGEGHCTNFADYGTQEVVDEFFRFFWIGVMLHWRQIFLILMLIRIAILIQEFLTEFLPLQN